MAEYTPTATTQSQEPGSARAEVQISITNGTTSLEIRRTISIVQVLEMYNDKCRTNCQIADIQMWCNKGHLHNAIHEGQCSLKQAQQIRDIMQASE